MAEVLVKVTRNGLTECMHRGDIAVVDYNGNLLRKTGDPFKFTYMRSAAKFFQALNPVLCGAGGHFEFTDREYAITCGSHYAEPIHLKTVDSILRKAGLTAEAIQGGTVTSLKWTYALELASRGETLTPLHSDCSGKHAGMLASAVFQGLSTNTYLQPGHPVQQQILDIISAITQYPKSQIQIGIDGCSAPVHAMPLYYMALGFARFAKSQVLDTSTARAANKLFHAATKHPEMLAGTNGFCSDLVKVSNGKLIGKIGAEGVYCVGIKDQGTGIAVKVENGNMNMLPPVIMKILEDLSVLNNDEMHALRHYRCPANLNDVETEVGAIRPVFELDQVL